MTISTIWLVSVSELPQSSSKLNVVYLSRLAHNTEIDFCFSLAMTFITSPPIGGGRGIVMPMSVCLCVCLSVCLSVFSQNFKV